MKSSTAGISAATEEKQALNYQMCILSVIGICFVLLGHLKNDLYSFGTFSGWFSYYSFHMPLFLFISGYFFRDPDQSAFLLPFGRFVWKRFRKLMIPFYVFNGIFILVNMLISQWGFRPIRYTFIQWLLSPVTELQPATFSFSTWYLTGLFFAEIFYYLLRKGFSLILKKSLLKEVLLLALIFLMAVASCYLRETGSLPDTAVIFLRSVVMMFFIQIGYLYRHYLEQIDHLSGAVYFPIIFALQFVLILLNPKGMVSPLLYSLEGFGRTGFLYYYAGITGIALWLRISRYIASIPGNNRLLVYTGRHTKYILAFHITGFFLLNCLFSLCYKWHLAETLLQDFDPEAFSVNYFFYNLAEQSSPQTLLLYFLAGMVFSLGLSRIIELISCRIRLCRKKEQGVS